jgi:ubiquinone/menaquinone biosynthesis C-methylase UbiE
MNGKEVLESLYLYKKNEFTCKFLEDTILFFKKIDTIYEIGDNAFMLAGIRIYLLYKTKYIYLLNGLNNDKNSDGNKNSNGNKNISYRKIKMSKKALFNFTNQIDGIINNDFAICKKLKPKSIINYLVISNIPIKGHNIIEEDIYLPLLGIQSLFFLEKQNLEHYCDPIIMSNANKMLKDLSRLRKIFKSFNKLDRNRFFIFSGLLYYFLGAIYTEDIDCIVIGKTLEEIEFYKKKIPFVNDILSVCSDNNLPVKSYHNNFYKYILPQWGGSENIYEVLINPEKHFYFMGLKCFDLYSNFQRSINRSHPFTFIDMIMLKKINNIDIYKNFCIKNISIRDGRALITNDKQGIKIFYNTVIKHLKDWYNITIEDTPKKSIKFLENNLVKCPKNKTSLNLYKDPYMIEQMQIHKKIYEHYIKKYSNGVLLDIGCGKLIRYNLYEKTNLNEVYGIDILKNILHFAKKKIKNKSNIKYTLLNAYGNKPFLFDKKFDIILFIFTLQHMINNINIVINNLNKVSKSGTYIIITCINGNKIISSLKTNNKYEITNNDFYWGAYKYNEKISKFPCKALIFIKDIYGYQNGIEESLIDVNELIKIFKKNNFKLDMKKSFKECYREDINKLKDFQIKILDIYEILIFVKQ